MDKITKTIYMLAPREKVGDTMLNKETYDQWASAFHEGSTYEGRWAKGSKIRFVGPNEDGTIGGIVSMVVDNQLHSFISTQPVGLIKGDEEDATSPEAQQWLGGFENYTFTDKDGGTELKIEVDVPADFKP